MPHMALVATGETFELVTIDLFRGEHKALAFKKFIPFWRIRSQSCRHWRHHGLRRDRKEPFAIYRYLSPPSDNF
jgi:hypothetical protein